MEASKDTINGFGWRIIISLSKFAIDAIRLTLPIVLRARSCQELPLG